MSQVVNDDSLIRGRRVRLKVWGPDRDRLIIELRFRVGFRVRFSSWIFELDFRVGQCKVQIADQEPVVQPPINAKLRLKINKIVLLSTPKCCSRLIFGKTLH